MSLFNKIVHTIGLNSIAFVLIVTGTAILPDISESSRSFMALSILFISVYLMMIWFDKLGIKIFDEEKVK